MSVNLVDQPKWIVKIHLNQFIKDDFKELKMENFHIECLLKELRFLEFTNLTDMDTDTRIQFEMRLSKVRKGLSDCQRYLDSIATNWQKVISDNYFSKPMLPSQHINEVLREKISVQST